MFAGSVTGRTRPDREPSRSSETACDERHATLLKRLSAGLKSNGWVPGKGSEVDLLAIPRENLQPAIGRPRHAPSKLAFEVQMDAGNADRHAARQMAARSSGALAVRFVWHDAPAASSRGRSPDDLLKAVPALRGMGASSTTEMPIFPIKLAKRLPSAKEQHLVVLRSGWSRPRDLDEVPLSEFVRHLVEGRVRWWEVSPGRQEGLHALVRETRCIACRKPRLLIGGVQSPTMGFHTTADLRDRSMRWLRAFDALCATDPRLTPVRPSREGRFGEESQQAALRPHCPHCGKPAFPLDDVQDQIGWSSRTAPGVQCMKIEVELDQADIADEGWRPRWWLSTGSAQPNWKRM